MSEPTIDTLDLQVLENFNVILQEITDLIVTENAFLSVSNDPPPMPLIEKKEKLEAEYSTLTVKLKKHASALHAAEKLNPSKLEQNIRHLVGTVKTNQTLLNAHKVATAQRVETVMKTLSDREKKTSFCYGATGSNVSDNTTATKALQIRI